MIECCTSGCVNPHTSYYGDGVAEKHWNTRAAVPAVEWLVKALELLLHVRGTSEDTPGVRDQAESALSRFRSLQNGGAE
jgi:hypothetical protein